MVPEASYVICATPRSGSYLLCEALAGTGVAGRPEEALWRGNMSELAKAWSVDPANTSAYVAAMLHAGTAGGWFGTKVMWGYLDEAAALLGEIGGTRGTPLQVLSRALPHVRFIYMHRTDLTRQAVSWWRALASDSWAEMQGVGVVGSDTPILTTPESGLRNGPLEFEYDFDGIRRRRLELVEHNRGWRLAFAQAGIRPIELTYEELAADISGASSRVVRELGVTGELQFQPPRMQRQSDGRTEELVARHERDVIARRLRRLAPPLGNADAQGATR